MTEQERRQQRISEPIFVKSCVNCGYPVVSALSIPSRPCLACGAEQPEVIQ